MNRPATSPRLTSTWISAALQSTDWVDATPFRAHLHYLVGASQLSGRVVGQFCGIPTRLADRLLAVGGELVSPSGSPIRRARRISHYCAARLLAVRPADLAALRWSSVGSAPTLSRLEQLARAGHDLDAVAAAVGASATELALVAAHRWVDCRQLLAVQVDAACQVLLGDPGSLEPGERHDIATLRRAS